MQQPVTELDTRFSDQNAVATDWEETRRALEAAGFEIVRRWHESDWVALEAGLPG